MEKAYAQRIDHLESSQLQLEKELDAKEKSRGSLNTLLQDAILRFRKNFQSLQRELA
jgi:flagellar capping protein FliD